MEELPAAETANEMEEEEEEQELMMDEEQEVEQVFPQDPLLDDTRSMFTSLAMEENLLRSEGIEVKDIKTGMLQRFDKLQLDNSMVSGTRG